LTKPLGFIKVAIAQRQLQLCHQIKEECWVV
jgi:hypothetical protein